jgi:putative spermidine/putrescine transport system permease protein
MPLWVNTVIRGFGFRILLAENGIVNGAMAALRLITQPVRFMGTELGVFLGLTQISIPYVILPLLSVLQTIPPSMKEAAQSVGANKLQTFFRITLPLSIPGINAASVLVFALNISSLAVPQMLGGGRVRMAAAMAYNQTATLGNFPFGAAIGMVIFLLTAGATVFYFRAVSRFYAQR